MASAKATMPVLILRDRAHVAIVFANAGGRRFG